MPSPLTPASVLSEVSRTYDRRVMNNVHKSGYVEAIVALALKDSRWTRMIPWDSWEVQLREKVQRERRTGKGNRDTTRYDLSVSGNMHPNLSKRDAVLRVV